MSHAIPPLEELKQHAYCKWHNSFSHATNDCNMFRRQIQSGVNESRLVVPQMQVDWLFHKYKLIVILSLCIMLNYRILRF